MRRNLTTSFSIEPGLLKIVDRERGRVPRSVYLCDILRERYGLPIPGLPSESDESKDGK